MVKIISSHYELGQKKESLKDLCEINKDWDYDRLLLKTGIKNRHILAENETPEALSIKTGRACINKSKNKNVDGIIYVTQSPSLPLPTRACFLQDKLGINKNSFAFDINQGCSGFVYAISTADQFIKTGMYKNILVIGSENHSGGLDFSTRGRAVSVIFGDGAGAAVVSGEDDL